MPVVVLLRRKCTLAASHATLVSHVEYTPMGQTDRRTDGRRPDRYSTLSARRGQHNNKAGSLRGMLFRYEARR